MSHPPFMSPKALVDILDLFIAESQDEHEDLEPFELSELAALVGMQRSEDGSFPSVPLLNALLNIQDALAYLALPPDERRLALRRANAVISHIWLGRGG